MKMLMQGVCLAVAMALTAGAQTPAPADQDKAAVRQAAYDYGEGFYEGTAERMERAVHPAVIKRGLVSPPAGGGLILAPMNAETLVETTRRGGGKQTPADKRNISFALLHISDYAATAKIFTAQFNDYLHLVKQDGRWRIANVLWQPPSPTGAVNAEADKAAVAQVLKEYVDGLAAADPTPIERLTHPEAALRVFPLSPPPGRPFLVENNRDAVVAAMRSKRNQPLPSPVVTVLDVYDNIASGAMTASNGVVGYWHLARQNGQWRVVNVLLSVPPLGMTGR